jgi:16S rRNA (uracil1498-N3)-methyltransferase
MRRYWISSDDFDGREIGNTVRLTGDTLHHIRDVCRQDVGDIFEVLDDGQAYLVQVTVNSKREMQGQIREVRKIEPLPFPRVRLALAIPRLNVFEAVLEKMVELGVEEVQPLFSDNSFLKTDTEAWRSKESRFQKIILSATQQSGRGEKMRLLPAKKLAEFVEELRAEINRGRPIMGLFAYEVGNLPIKEALRQEAAKRDSALAGAPELVWAFIGGEGGFSRTEVSEFAARGFPAVTLGRQVLRVETACVALISVLKYELDLMR